MRTYKKIYTDYEAVRIVVLHLLAASQWFQLEPLPDGAYELTVKAELERRLNQVLMR